MAELRLGILGGTFNPIHVGHLVFAESFRERLALDRVLFVPAGMPPHKAARGLASAIDRYAMASLAVAGHPGFVASATEVARPGPSYSVDTVERLAGDWPGARLFFLMGSDTFLDLPTWRTPERLGTFATLAVGLRAGSPFDPDAPAARAVLARLGGDTWRRLPPAVPEALAPGDVALVETRSLPVSAREVRRALAAGESVRYRVPPPVAEYIAAHQLYREPA
ncbi:MAG: nicotinate (nicotinamide) nucleotide adenylyltransferase [Candidatus Rokuibacteriota bacterium]|nr:MAG: nicotinate (nicotinamide) nucleotide adenylyltransferase [Candidatus Rokubacteria bacterium]